MEQRIELAPNGSLTPSGARLFLAVTGLFSLSISLACAAFGFWPVVAFWALEMLALALALRASMRQRRYTQTLLITEAQVSLVTRSARGEAKLEFARHWAKVRLRTSQLRTGNSCLTIESRGRAYEVGRFLTEEARCRLADRLGVLVGGMNESPPLEVAELAESGDPF